MAPEHFFRHFPRHPVLGWHFRSTLFGTSPGEGFGTSLNGIRYFLWTPNTYKNSLGFKFPIARTSVAQKKCCRIMCQGAAKGGRQKEFDHFFFVFGTLSVTFWSLILTLLSLFLSLFCQIPFAGLLLRQGECV